MDDAVRRSLIDLCQSHGVGILDDAVRLDAFLHDMCPGRNAEIHCLGMAVREGVVSDLRNADKQGGFSASTQARLAERLVQRLGMGDEAAAWTVAACAAALGLADVSPVPTAVSAPARPAASAPRSAPAMYRGGPRRTGAFDVAQPPTLSRRLWRFATKGQVRSSPVFCGGRLFFGSGDGRFFCLNAATGAELWQVRTGGPVLSDPAAADGMVFFGGNDGGIYAVDVASGRGRWRLETGATVSGGFTLANGLVYASDDDGRLYAVDAVTGSVRWRSDEGTVTGETALDASTLYVGVEDDSYCLLALDPWTGREHWRMELGAAAWFSPVVGDGLVYICDWQGVVAGVHCASGRASWRFSADTSVTTCPLLAAGALVLAGEDGDIFALDAQRGALFWHEKLDEGVLASPVAAGNALYIAGLGGGVFLLDQDTGQIASTADCGAPIFSTPTLANGALYVGCDDGVLYAFG